MEDALIRKIRNALEASISTEQKLVHFLVELRKLLDREKYSDTTVRTFCNWVVHSELTQARGGVTPLLVELDESIRTSATGSLEFIWPEHYTLRSFREHLQEILKYFNLPTELTKANDVWKLFVRLYTAAVTAAPIVFTASKEHLKYIEKVELIRWPPVEQVGEDFSTLAWRISRKDGLETILGFNDFLL